jgi:hypothetical protein
MPGWRIARAFRAISGIYRIPHTLMTQGSMILRETCIGHWLAPFAKGASQKKSPDSRRGSRFGPVPSGPHHAIAFLIRRSCSEGHDQKVMLQLLM